MFFKKTFNKILQKIADLEYVKVKDLQDNLMCLGEKVSELRAISKTYAHKHVYPYTSQEAKEQTIKEGYELAYKNSRCGYEIWIKRERPSS